MSKDLIFSVVLHLSVVGLTFLTAPFAITNPPEFGEVIRVTAVSMADIAPAQPNVIAPPEIPQAMAMAPEEIPIDNPTTKPAVEVEEPVKEPEPEPPKPEVTPPVQAQPAEHNQTGAADSQTEVQAPAGTSISGVSVDNASFNYPYWFTLTWNKLNQNFRIPIQIDGKVYCDVYFQVIKSGRMIEVKVNSSSGLQQFDEACVAAVERSAPFAPLPGQFLDEIIGITITFTN
ncbi:MAG: TonB family protein [bacterium]|nr:TonB family protein [bacterium]